jgi:ribosomal-protein-alanine N-acetyltransferase
MALFRLSKMIEPEPLLRGDGIYLRPATSADFPAWARLRAESRAFLTPWEPTWPDDDLTRASFRRRLRRQAEETARDESYPFLIFEATSDALLGGLTLGGIRRGVAQAGTLGYWMGASHAGRGHMTRAVAAALRHGFSTLRLHRIEAACLPQNIASMTLLERNGFQREGLAKAYLKINGAWRDHVLYARIEPEASRLG